MITRFRQLIVEDFWLKLFSLGVAILIWLTVSVAIRKEVTFPSNPLERTEPRTFLDVPVLVVSAAADVRNFKVNPSTVEVTVRGTPETMARLQDRDVRVIVDLSDIESARYLRKRVDVTMPPDVTLINVFPAEVSIVIPPKL